MVSYFPRLSHNVAERIRAEATASLLLLQIPEIPEQKIKKFSNKLGLISCHTWEFFSRSLNSKNRITFFHLRWNLLIFVVKNVYQQFSWKEVIVNEKNKFCKMGRLTILHSLDHNSTSLGFD